MRQTSRYALFHESCYFISLPVVFMQELVRNHKERSLLELLQLHRASLQALQNTDHAFSLVTLIQTKSLPFFARLNLQLWL